MSRRVHLAGLVMALTCLVVATTSVGAFARTPRPETQQMHSWKGTRWIKVVKARPDSWTSGCEKSAGFACYIPRQLEHAYDLTQLYRHGLDGTGSTIAIVDAFGSPTVRKDLQTFDAEFGLPAPPSLRIIRPAGQVPPFDPSNGTMVGWAVETSLDVQWAHAIAPGASILLVETPVAETEGIHGFPPMIKAENYVVDHHMADVISQSFAATEQTFPNAEAIRSLRSAYINARNHHVTVVGATGDAGASNYRLDGQHFYKYPVTSWPAVDPLVTAVGGTQLHLNNRGDRTAPDNVWNDTYNPVLVGKHPSPIAGGGGLSTVFGRPGFQDGVSGVVGSARGIPDISMSAAVDGGVITYLGFLGRGSGFYIIGGTSEATPEFAAVVSIADQAAGRSLGFINPALYRLAARHAPGIVDITAGNNTVSFRQHGQEFTVDGYSANPGYDLASGLGTVDAADLVRELAHS